MKQVMILSGAGLSAPSGIKTLLELVVGFGKSMM